MDHLVIDEAAMMPATDLATVLGWAIDNDVTVTLACSGSGDCPHQAAHESATAADLGEVHTDRGACPPGPPGGVVAVAGDGPAHLEGVRCRGR